MYYFLSSVFISFYGYSSENFIDPTTLSRHMTESRFLVTTLEFEISFLQGSFTVLVKLSFWWTVPPLLRFDVCLTSFFVSFLYFLLLSLLYSVFTVLSILFYNYFYLFLLCFIILWIVYFFLICLFNLQNYVQKGFCKCFLHAMQMPGSPAS